METTRGSGFWHRLTRLAGIALICASGAARADTFVNSWHFEIDADFNSAMTFFSSPSVSNHVTAQSLSWGDSTGFGQSSLVIGNDPSSGTIVSNDLAGAATLTVTHNNEPVTGATLTSTVIDSELTLYASDPNDPTAVIDAQTIAFSILFAETPNSTPCVASSPTPCNDIFVLSSGLLNYPFSYNGYDYYLNILNITGGGLTALSPLPDAVCAAAGAGSGCLGFTTVEGQANTFQFGLTITGTPLTVDVPEPATLALWGAGLGLLGWGGRARRRH